MLTRDELHELRAAHDEALSGRDRLVLRMRLDDRQTLLKIGRALGLSTERIRQIEVEAIHKLQTVADGQA